MPDSLPNQRMNKFEDIVCNAVLEMTGELQTLSSRVTTDRALDLLIYIAILSGHPIDVWPAVNAIATLDFWRSSAGYQVDRL